MEQDTPILIVDHDLDRAYTSADMIRQRLDLDVFAMHDHAQACAWIQRNEPQLVLLEVPSSPTEPFEVLRHLHNTWPGTPAILTLSEDSPRLNLLSLPQLSRPFTERELLREVHYVIRSGIGDTLLTDLLMSHAQFGASGSVHIRSLDDHGEVGFASGELIHAGTRELIGRDALASILSWRQTRVSKLNPLIPRTTMNTEDAEGLLRFTLKTHHSRPVPSPQTLADTTQDTESPSSHPLQALLDTLDDDDELFSYPPITLDEGALDIDVIVTGDDIETLDVGAFLGDLPSFSTTNPGVAPRTKESPFMSNNINASLDKFKSLNGYVGVSLVDSESGMMLGSDGGGSINMEVAAAANSEVIKSKRQAIKRLKLKEDIDDILITLNNQYHLIRPFRKRPALFFYLVLDRSRSNLALARMELSDVEEDLEL